MKTIDEITEAEKAWLVWRKLAELNSLLWETYYLEFRELDTRERSRPISADNLPF